MPREEIVARQKVRPSTVLTAAERLWLRTHGSIPPGKRVVMTCGDASCGDPGHLLLADAVVEVPRKRRSSWH